LGPQAVLWLRVDFGIVGVQFKGVSLYKHTNTVLLQSQSIHKDHKDKLYNNEWIYFILNIIQPQHILKM